jgi:hypothetical protein
MKFAYPPPTDGKPFRLSMGLRELNVANWLEAGTDLADQIKERNLIAHENRDQVFQQLPGHDAGADYFTKKIVENHITYNNKLIGIRDDKDVVLKNGQYGLYVIWNKQLFTLPKFAVDKLDKLDISSKESDSNSSQSEQSEQSDDSEQSKSVSDYSSDPYNRYLSEGRMKNGIEKDFDLPTPLSILKNKFFEPFKNKPSDFDVSKAIYFKAGF